MKKFAVVRFAQSYDMKNFEDVSMTNVSLFLKILSQLSRIYTSHTSRNINTSNMNYTITDVAIRVATQLILKLSFYSLHSRNCSGKVNISIYALCTAKTPTQGKIGDVGAYFK